MMLFYVLILVQIAFSLSFVYVNRNDCRLGGEVGACVFFSFVAPPLVFIAYYLDNYAVKNKKLIKLDFLDNLKRKEYTVSIKDKWGNKIDIPENKKMEVAVTITSVLKD